MKKKIVGIFLMCITMIMMVQVSVFASNITKSKEHASEYGFLINYKDVNGNLYFVKENKIVKYNLEGNEKTELYTFNDNIYYYNTTVKGNIVYLYASTIDENSKYIYRVIKYDIKNNKELQKFSINVNEKLPEDSYIWNLVVDDEGFLYFRYASNAAVKYDKNGKFVKLVEDYTAPYSQNSDFYKGDYIYTKGSTTKFYRYNTKTKKIDGTYTIDENDFKDKYYDDYTVIDNDIYVLLRGKEDGYYYINRLTMKKTTTKKYTKHKALKHSIDEIINKYEKLKATFNYKKSVYEKNPSYKNGKYVAGSLKSRVIKDTLNQINFYRWLSGLNTVSKNDKYMERSQKGAVILAKLKQLTHYPSKPSDMSDSWYKDAYAGVNAGYDYTGNVSVGTMVNNSPVEFILDTNNIMGGVGHRLSLLDKKSDKTSFGYCDGYTAISMYTTSDDLGNNDLWYSWPSPGYFPIEKMDPKMQWSITLDSKLTIYDDFKIVITDGNNKKYTLTPSSNLYYESYFNTVYFDAPAKLIKYLTNNGNKFVAGRKFSVKITGLADENYDAAEISYTTEFIKTERKEISSLNISNIKNRKYTGKALTPNPTIKDGNRTLKKGTDYTLTYSNNKKTGKAKIVIEGKGNYKGTATKYFNIIPQAPTITKITTKSKKANLKWSKSIGATGYEVYMATSKNGKFEKIKTITSQTLKYTKSKLKKKKKYFFKIRPYKKIDGKKVYGSYSDVKSIKVK